MDRASRQIGITADIWLLSVRGNGPSVERFTLLHQIYVGFVIRVLSCEKMTVILEAILHKL